MNLNLELQQKRAELSTLQVNDALSLITLVRQVIEKQEEPDLYPVEDVLRMAIDRLAEVFERLDQMQADLKQATPGQGGAA